MQYKAGERIHITNTLHGRSGFAFVVSPEPDADGDIRVVMDDTDDNRTDFIWSQSTVRRTLRKRWVPAVRATKRPFDLHEFRAFMSPDGTKCFIVAGCRSFTLAEARAHWSTRQRATKGIWRTGADDPCNAWSLKFVDRVQRAMP